MRRPKSLNRYCSFLKPSFVSSTPAQPVRCLNSANFLAWTATLLESAHARHSVLNFNCTGPGQQTPRQRLRYGRGYTNAKSSTPLRGQNPAPQGRPRADGCTGARGLPCYGTSSERHYSGCATAQWLPRGGSKLAVASANSGLVRAGHRQE